MRLIWPWQDRNRRFSWLKAGAFALVLLPGIRFAYQFGTGEYGTLPIALGGMTYVRRMVGVTALAYTLAHIVIYFALRSWNFGFIVNEMATRLSMIVATLSTIGLVALGATSLDAVIRYMGAKSWQRLHNANYAISGLAVLHVVLARGTYGEQYMLAGIFVWLMVWRLLARYGLGADAKALTLLTAATCILTALLEAGWLWGRRGYELSWTLSNNFSLAALDVGVPPAWQVLAFGLVFALGAFGREAVRALGAAPRQVES